MKYGEFLRTRPQDLGASMSAAIKELSGIQPDQYEAVKAMNPSLCSRISQITQMPLTSESDIRAWVSAWKSVFRQMSATLPSKVEQNRAEGAA